MSVCEMQQVLADAQRADVATRAEIDHALVNAVRIAATGTSLATPPPPGAPGGPAFRPPWGIGRAYCELVAPLFHANTAAAQGTPAAASQQSAPPPSSGAPSSGVPSSGAPSAGASQPNRLSETRGPQLARPAATVPPAPPRAPVPVTPTTAAMTLSTVTPTLDAAHARVDDNHRTLNTYDVEIQKKFAIAVACVVFVLLGAPIALRFPRGGVGLVIGVSFGVFGLYYVGLIAGEPLAQNGTVSPFWAMWCSNIIFTAVGAVLLARVGRAGSTARGGDLSEVKDAVRNALARLRRPRRGPARALRRERIA
jgi:lipopolysaccharide export system permease protein